MKIHFLVFVFLLTLAGCSTSYKGSIKVENDPGTAKNGKYIVSHTASDRSGALTLH